MPAEVKRSCLAQALATAHSPIRGLRNGGLGIVFESNARLANPLLFNYVVFKTCSVFYAGLRYAHSFSRVLVFQGDNVLLEVLMGQCLFQLSSSFSLEDETADS